jgi:hypothetical protein
MDGSSINHATSDTENWHKEHGRTCAGLQRGDRAIVWVRGVLGLVRLVGWSMGSPGISVAQEVSIAAAIHQGDCADLGDGVAFLTPPVIATGPQRGKAAALPAASSITEVPVSFDALRTSAYAVVLPMWGRTLFSPAGRLEGR